MTSNKSLTLESSFKGWNLFGEIEIDADSDQAKDSLKLFWSRGPYVSFSTARLHPGSWVNRLCESRIVFMWRFVWRKEEFYGVISMLSVEISWVVFRSVVISAKVVFLCGLLKALTDKTQIFGWTRFTRKLCAKRASWRGGHFVCACVRPLNDNSVGVSNLMVGNRKPGVKLQSFRKPFR